MAEAKTIQQSKAIADVAAAAEIYAKRQQLGQEAIDYAHSIKIEALRKVGEMLKETPKATGAAGIGKPASAVPNEYRTQPETLAELGIDKKTSSIAQKLADLPEKDFAAVRDGHETIGKAIAKVAEKKQEKTVPIQAEPEPTIPLKQYRVLEEKYQELVEELETFSSIDGGDVAKDMKNLRESLRLANRRRDELMVETAEKQKQIDYYRRELKKLGWKQGK